jgi:hypothetical protein
MKNKTLARVAAHAVGAIFAWTTAALAQKSDLKDLGSSKETAAMQEKEPFVQFIVGGGCMTEYNFRGTNLMPGSTGGVFYSAEATIPKWHLTLGIYGIHQIGTASSDSWSISEGGGGAGVARQAIQLVGGGFIDADRFPTTTQGSFREIDFFVSYKFSLGPVDVTLGNIGFFIDRKTQTFELDIIPEGFVWVNPPTFTRFATFGPLPTVEDETFDRVYVRLSSTRLCRHITPSITYYQTVYNEGTQRTAPFISTRDEFGNTIFIQGPGQERNEELGGYLEGRVSGNFPVGYLDIKPYGIISVSFGDRTEPVAGTFGGRPFTGFNHAQAGLELNFHITRHIAFVPFWAYSYHISEPPIGTNRHEFWGGVKVAVNF